MSDPTPIPTILMLLVIVGAGASFDSDPDHRPFAEDPPQNEAHRLPLADDLFGTRFAHILMKYPKLMAIVPEIRHRTDETVEEVLGRLAEESKRNKLRTMQLTEARFYIAEVIRTCQNGWCHGTNKKPTNMMWLVQKLEHARDGGERPVFVTFNYDTLIEEALATIQKPFEKMEDYYALDRTRLFKLHGSFDWIRVIKGVQSSRPSEDRLMGELHATIPSLESLDGPIIRSGSTSTDLRSVLHMPAIAIPVKHKATFECDHAHLQALDKLLAEVDSILTIGWRGGEEHFLRMLQSRIWQHNILLNCVAGGPNGETDANAALGILQRITVSSMRSETFSHGFSAFMQSGGYRHLAEREWSPENAR